MPGWQSCYKHVLIMSFTGVQRVELKSTCQLLKLLSEAGKHTLLSVMEDQSFTLSPKYWSIPCKIIVTKKKLGGFPFIEIIRLLFLTIFFSQFEAKEKNLNKTVTPAAAMLIFLYYNTSKHNCCGWTPADWMTISQRLIYWSKK